MASRRLTTKPPMAAQLNRADPLTHALVGAWLFNEGCGATAHDVGGARHTGAFSGAPTWTAGPRGPVVAFDGADDWISMGDCLNLGTDDITVLVIAAYSAASQPDNWLGTCQGAIVGKGHLDYTSKGYGLSVETANKISWELRNGGTSYAVTSDSALNDGNYHTVIGVCDRDDSNGLRLYVDGVRQSAVVDPSALDGTDLAGSTAFAVGSRQEQTNSTWNWDFLGSVACVYVWKRVLTEGEIRALQCDPFRPFVCNRRVALLCPPAGEVVTFAGSIGAQSGASATLGVARNLSGATGGQSQAVATLRATKNVAGSAAATTSLSASLRATKTLAGTCGVQTSATAALTVTRIVPLSGTIACTSRLTGVLRVPFVPPSCGAAPDIATPWLREALFHGMTGNAFKLGTALTQGWFWTRRAGCAAVYRGASRTDVDFDNVVSVANADASQVALPGYLPHEPGTRCYYAVRRFNACGVPERTTGAAVAVRVDADGSRAPDAPNAVFAYARAQVEGNRVRLLWFYCPLEQDAGPAHFHVYSDNGTGSACFETPLAVVPYEGQRFYRFRSDPLEPGTYRFVVRAVDETGTEETSPADTSFQIEVSTPPTVEILAAEPCDKGDGQS